MDSIYSSSTHPNHEETCPRGLLTRLQVANSPKTKTKSGSLKDKQEWGKKDFEDLDQRRMGKPVTRKWSTDFFLRETSSREEIGKCKSSMHTGG